MKTIIEILNDRYDAGLGVFDPTPILWAAERASEVIGVDAAKAELKKVNRRRERMGLLVAVFPFGHKMF